MIVMSNGDRYAHIFNVSSGEELFKIEHTDVVDYIAFSPGGARIASGGADGVVHVVEVNSWNELVRIETGDQISALAFSDTAHEVVVGTTSGLIYVWDDKTGIKKLMGKHDDAVSDVFFGSSSSWIISSSQDNIRLWKVSTGLEVAHLTLGEENPIIEVDRSPDGDWMALSLYDKTVRLYDTRTLQENGAIVQDVRSKDNAISADGTLLISGTEDGKVTIWKTDGGSELLSILVGNNVNGLKFLSDKNLLFVDSFITGVWSVSDGSEISTLKVEGEDLALYHAAISPDKKSIIAVPGSEQNLILEWDIASNSKTGQYLADSEIKLVVFSPDGTRIAGGAGDGSIFIWGVGKENPIVRLKTDGWVSRLAFTRNGSFLAGVGKANKGAFIWDASTGALVQTLSDGPYVYDLDSNPTENLVSYSVEGSGIHVWDMSTQSELRNDNSAGDISVVKFSPDGKYLIAGSYLGNVAVTNARSNWLEVSRSVHGSKITAITVSQDSRWVISGSEDGEVRIWDLQTGEQLSRILLSKPVTAIAISSDGHLIAIGSDDDPYVRVWTWQASDIVDQVCHRVPRNLHIGEWQQYLGTDILYRPICPNLPIPENAQEELQRQRMAAMILRTFGGLLLFFLLLFAWVLVRWNIKRNAFCKNGKLN